jgi:uncharacterized membrane protein YfcA
MICAEQLAVLAAGLGAGILTSTVGVASLLSFPVLVAVGLPPVVANTSNTIGMAPAGLSGSFGYRRELAEQPTVSRVILLTSALGSVAGSLLLLGLPSEVFESLIPWLILGTCLLVGIQPRLTAWVRRHSLPRTDRRTRVSVPTGAHPPLTRPIVSTGQCQCRWTQLSTAHQGDAGATTAQLRARWIHLGAHPQLLPPRGGVGSGRTGNARYGPPG